MLCALWQPLPQVIYDLKGGWGEPVMYALYGFGWFVGLSSTFLIDHFDLFGLKQGWYHWKGRYDFRYRFQTPLFYRLVRHPIYTGWLMIHWFTPVMTLGHLLLAVVITAYIYIAIQYEERDLLDQFGEQYQQYAEVTPKLIPLVKKKRGG